MHVSIRELSPALQTVLRELGYHGADIECKPATDVESYVGANDGQRGSVTVVNLDTGQARGMTGSWGSGWATSAVDTGDVRIPIPTNGAVIKATHGYPRTFATLYAHPDAFGRMLPAGDSEELTDEEQQAIYCFAAIKGGEYRREEMRRRNVSDATVDALVQRGYLKRNRAGSTQITTKGKNARTVRN